ncbi:hypothetical protein POX52_23995, partial [Escherichia coli]
MMNPVPWLQMTNMISYQGLVRTFPNTLYLTQSCVEKFGSQLEAQDLFNKLPQYLVNSGAVINTKCHAFNMPTLLAASDRAKVDIERIINNLKEAGNL